MRFALAAGALLAAPLLALGESQPSAEELKRLEAEGGRLGAKQKQIQAEIDKNQADIGRISAHLVETGKLIQQSEARRTIIEARLAELDAKEREVRSKLEQKHGTISALLAALQRIGRNPPPVMITQREDALTMVRSAMLLSSAFPGLRDQAVGLAKELKDLAEVRTAQVVARNEADAEKARHDEVRVKLATLQEEKRRAGAKQQAELDSVRQEVARIAKSVQEMGDLLQRVDKPVAVLAPKGEQRLASIEPGRIKPNVPFEQAKGILQLPSQGHRILSFGQRTSYGTVSKGIWIQTRYGGTIVSPCDGLIVYAGEFRAYGQLLIISPGGGYHVLLAGLSQIDVQVGQSVLMGEPVGVMSTAAKTPAAQDNGPVLTVEFRKDQRPIDPDPWWSDASRKVQG